MLSLEEAQHTILKAIQPLAAEQTPLSDALGRVLAEKIVSAIDLPPFDNSAMDGYAVQSKDVAKASAASPVSLSQVGTIAAGGNITSRVESGRCVRIFTGSPLPSGADAVVMQEDTRSDGNKILVLDSVKPWENIRFHGEDVKAGATVANPGNKLSLGQISLLASLGTRSVAVTRRPIVGLLATGSELLEAGQPLAPGKIFESNRIGLSLLATRSGAIPKVYPLVEDTLDATVAALETAFTECDCVVTSGGVSVGEFDFVKSAFEQLGGELSFWKVAIRPGKPFVFGRWREKFLFGVPGNPVSALVTFFLLVRPALARLQGTTNCLLPTHPAVLAEPLSNHGDRRHFMRVSVDELGNVQSAGIQASHILSSLANANGLVDLPPNAILQKGTTVSVLRWD
ncbi:MAG: Molybdopterin molybdenumtransferase MoeA [Verrucomicrobiales bacterium]|nr:Molybdopterin molybdenumtransferase MoeA [Verrucomicrobiales bacterium]